MHRLNIELNAQTNHCSAKHEKEIKVNNSLQHWAGYMLGPVVQSVVSLTSSLRVISLTVLADSIYSILIFFAEKM